MSSEREFKKNKDELIEEMIEEFGYIFCQRCEKNKCGMKFETHHIIFRSEAPKHKNLNNKKNLIILGSECHEYFHKSKRRRNYLIEERGILDLFDNLSIFV